MEYAPGDIRSRQNIDCNIVIDAQANRASKAPVSLWTIFSIWLRMACPLKRLLMISLTLTTPKSWPRKPNSPLAFWGGEAPSLAANYLMRDFSEPLATASVAARYQTFDFQLHSYSGKSILCMEDNATLDLSVDTNNKDSDKSASPGREPLP
ncbi:hypothetical protein [Microbulbifer sp. ZKSA002]|uniref:hypothetical protein n=1 Tax=Microbulbifer sp. ZKSA002 TaxID=3243388 RepID=UPI0040392767